MANISFLFMAIKLICYGTTFKPLGKVQKSSLNQVRLEVNSENTNYMIISHHQNVIQNHNVVIGNLSFDNVKKFSYQIVIVTNTNDIREKNKCR